MAGFLAHENLQHPPPKKILFMPFDVYDIFSSGNIVGFPKIVFKSLEFLVFIIILHHKKKSNQAHFAINVKQKGSVQIGLILFPILL